jgi:hypothetical protein
MSKRTRIVGYIVLGITEAIIGLAFWLCVADRVTVASYQLAVFGIVWSAVGFKNFVDMKKNGNAPRVVGAPTPEGGQQ